MSFFYGWVIVAVGIVVSCIGMGGVMSLGVVLGADGRHPRLVSRGDFHGLDPCLFDETERPLCVPEAGLELWKWDIGRVGMSHQSAYVFPQHISFRRGTPCFSLQFALMTI